ncbi:unnamed protein product [Scytosiphon promiscuus]
MLPPLRCRCMPSRGAYRCFGRKEPACHARDSHRRKCPSISALFTPSMGVHLEGLWQMVTFWTSAASRTHRVIRQSISDCRAHSSRSSHSRLKVSRSMLCRCVRERRDASVSICCRAFACPRGGGGREEEVLFAAVCLRGGDGRVLPQRDTFRRPSVWTTAREHICSLLLSGGWSRGQARPIRSKKRVERTARGMLLLLLYTYRLVFLGGPTRSGLMNSVGSRSPAISSSRLLIDFCTVDVASCSQFPAY